MTEDEHNPGLRVRDFNERQAYIPLELCRSWEDLCTFLGFFLGGQVESRFIAPEAFSLRVRHQKDLFFGLEPSSRGKWNSWMHNINEDPKELDVTFDMYAIVRDETNSCPHCKEPTLVLPASDDYQECLTEQANSIKCKHEYLEHYPEAELSSTTSTTPQLSHSANSPTTSTLATALSLPSRTLSPVVMSRARPEALKPAKPGPFRPGQARPDGGLVRAQGSGLNIFKPGPARQALAWITFFSLFLETEI
ncbi:hypothetical protein C8R45DRAFT_936472 [Mycena sanguinolenta]|nr:hypothetical protein C8R45DRAFT_936472 [Mycena sanguinolenta]